MAATKKKLTPAQRSLHAKVAAHHMHARHDATKTTAAGRAAFMQSFRDKVDPDGVLDPEERERRAEHARKAYFLSLRLKRSQQQTQQAS